MASGVACLCRLLVILLTSVVFLQLCSSIPVNNRQHKMMAWESNSRERGNDLCFLCEGAVTILKEYLENNSSINDIYPAVKPFCEFFMNKTHGYNGAYMCPGVIYSYGPVVLYVIAEGALNPSDICYLLHLCNKSSSAQQDLPHLPSFMKELGRQSSPELAMARTTGTERSVHFTPVDNDRERELSRVGERGKTVGDDTITFVQVSDIHLDQLFTEGSPSICNLYLCCRSWYNGTSPAGHYGNFNCDLPLATLDLVLEAITQLDPQPDFIVYTGDNSPHDIWNETWASQNEATQYLVSYLSQKIPNRYIYPALGNHETYPTSEYVGTLPEYQEWNHKMANYWSDLIPLPQSAIDTIIDGAYYTILVQDKLRILSFNSDYGYSINFYSTLNKHNIYYTRQHQWMIDTLEMAEKAGEKVMMIAHIPPGDPGNTLSSYEEFYLNLTRRYRDTIVAHLFGHTHHDEFKLVQDHDGVYGTVMICPSVTPYGRSNPSFRVFTMDSSSYQLTGYQQYHLNLTLANEMAAKGEKPKLELAYTTSDLYDLRDLSPASWAGLVERFSNYPDLVSDYRYNVYGRTSSGDKSCDLNCIHETICTVSNIISKERTKCTYPDTSKRRNSQD